MENVIIDTQKNSITFFFNQNVYKKEAIYQACYVFADKMQIYLGQPRKNVISVELMGKEKMKKSDFEKLKGDFLNELLNMALRVEIIRKNAKKLEQIVGGAIIASLGRSGQKEDQSMLDIEKEISSLKKELENTRDDYVKDPMGIKKINNIIKSRKRK